MENASNALIIGGGILIAMLIISIGVVLFSNSSELGSSYEQTLESTEIQKFNEKFLKFEGRDDIRIQEIVSLANFANQYERQTGTHISVILSGKGNLVEMIGGATDKNEALINIIDTDENLKSKFKCNKEEIDYFTEGSEKGKVKSITFTK